MNTNKITCKLSLTFDGDCLIDPLTLEEEFNGDWLEYLKTMLKEDGLCEFVRWCDNWEIVDEN